MPSDSRNKGARAYRRYDTYSPGREAWVELPRYTAVIYRNPEETDEEQEGRDFIRLSFHFGGRGRGMNLNLTTLTAPELRALKRVIDLAFETAEPICEALDTEAKEAFDQGDDARVRIYRPIPQVHVRERVQPEHRPSVRGGRDFLAGVGGADVLAGERPGRGEAVPDDAPGEVDSQDHEAQGE